MRLNVFINGQKHVHEVFQGENLASFLVDHGYLEGIECGRGLCRKCAVRLLKGAVAPKSQEDDIHKGLSEGYVLACRSVIGPDDIDVEVSAGKDDIQRKVNLPNLGGALADGAPAARKVYLKLPRPTLEDQVSDLERVITALGEGVSIRHGLLAKLPSLLRASNFEVTAVIIGDELAAVEAGDTVGENYGLIVDIGTTTVAIYLANLGTGAVLDAEGLANPQRVFGADVLSRISACSGDAELAKLQELVVAGIADSAKSLLDRNGVSANNVYSMIVVGNTTMSHLFLGVEPHNLAVAPFVPCYRSRVSLLGSHLDLPLHPEARIHVLANISGYVGSDTLGVAMATRPWECPGYSLAVDIGTNGEILLADKDAIWACSTAAGPAFEGAHIECGMRAGEGAIEKVRLENGRVILGVIGSCAPRGICGSGLIDAIAELLRAGLLERSGRFTAKPEGPYASRFRVSPSGIREFVLASQEAGECENDVVITQKDIRELQLAKAAIAAGIEILYKEAGIEAKDVQRLFLAGAFGNYLDRANAVALGLFPGIPVENIIPVGNAAAEGAGICLLSLTALLHSDRVASSIKPVELSTRKDFNEIWIRCMNFPSAK